LGDIPENKMIWNSSPFQWLNLWLVKLISHLHSA
jgi:hypothetical protein